MDWTREGGNGGYVNQALELRYHSTAGTKIVASAFCSNGKRAPKRGNCGDSSYTGGTGKQFSWEFEKDYRFRIHYTRNE